MTNKGISTSTEAEYKKLLFLSHGYSYFHCSISSKDGERAYVSFPVFGGEDTQPLSQPFVELL